jgi:hypothetical protein
VTGRLATLEEIVDWQPYEHAGYRLAVAEVGAVDATYDLEADGPATTVRLRWAASSGQPLDGPEIERLRSAKASALRRLRRVLAIPAAPAAGEVQASMAQQEV